MQPIGKFANYKVRENAQLKSNLCCKQTLKGQEMFSITRQYSKIGNVNSCFKTFEHLSAGNFCGLDISADTNVTIDISADSIGRPLVGQLLSRTTFERISDVTDT